MDFGAEDVENMIMKAIALCQEGVGDGQQAEKVRKAIVEFYTTKPADEKDPDNVFYLKKYAQVGFL